MIHLHCLENEPALCVQYSTVCGHNSRIHSSLVSLVSAKLTKIQRKFTVSLCEVVKDVIKKTNFPDSKKYSHSFLEYSICRGSNYVSYLYDQFFFAGTRCRYKSLLMVIPHLIRQSYENKPISCTP